MFCFLDSCFQHGDILRDFITNLATTILQKELVFFVLNVRCFLKQKTLRCFSGGSIIIPFSAFSSSQKVAIHRILFLQKKTGIAVENEDFFTNNNSVCGSAHICMSPNILTVPFKGPRSCSFSSISHSCQRSISTIFEMYCPKPIRGSEFPPPKSHSSELY